MGALPTFPQQQIPQIGVVPLQGWVEQQNYMDQQSFTQSRLNRLIQLYNHSRQMKQPHYSRWKRNYELYLNWDAEIKARRDHQSRVFVPRAFLIVETKTPRLVRGILDSEPIATVIPQSNDDLIRARVCSELLTKQMRTHPNITHELVTWFKDSFIYGNAIGKTGWQLHKELKQWREPAPPMVDFVSGQVLMPEVTRQEFVTTIDRPYFKNVEIGEIFPDPFASHIEDCNFVIHTEMVPWIRLKQLGDMGIYQDVDKIPRSNRVPQMFDEFANRKFSVMNITPPSSGNQMGPSIYDLVEVMECWWVDDTGRKMKTVVANQATIIQDITLPYWHNRFPFYKLNDVPMTKEFWSWGEIDPIADLIREQNDIRNAFGDNLKQFVKAFWALDRNGNIDLDQLENMPPGGILEVTGKPSEVMEVIRPPQLGDLTFSAGQQIDLDIQMTTGVNDISIGQSTRSQVRSATGAQLMGQATDTRYGLTALLYLEQMRKVFSDWLALNQQFMSKPVTVRLMGSDMMMNGLNYQVTPYDIPQEWDVYVALGSEFQGNKELQRQQKLQFFQLLMQFPWFNSPEYIMELMREFGEKDPQRFIVGGQPMQPDATQYIMQQLGIDDASVMSSYQEQQAGMAGGGTQSNPRIKQAASMPDLLQYSQNTNMLPSAGALNVR